MTDEETVIILYGTRWCFDSRRARAVFDDLEIPYFYIDIDKDPEARNYVQEVNNGFRSVPTIVFPDGSILVEPSNEILKEKLATLARG
ncbi:MAG: glutaredoxin domain-containing protein [Bellilinea sp.]